MSSNNKICDAIELVDSLGNMTKLNQIGFTNTLAGVNVTWEQIKTLESVTSAVRPPITPNILAVNNTFEANDDYLSKTRTAVLSAPPLVEPSLTLTNITGGDNSVLTTQTLTLNVSTNSAVLDGNGTLVLNDVGNGSILSLTPDSGLGIGTLPLPSSKYVNLDAYAGLELVDTGVGSVSLTANNTPLLSILDPANTCSLKLEPLTGLELYSSVFPDPYNSFAGLTNTGLTLLDIVSGDNNSLTAFNLTFNEIFNSKTGVFGSGGAVITEGTDNTSLIPTGLTTTKVGEGTMTFGYDNITHFDFANDDPMYIKSNVGVRLQIDNGSSGIINLDENYLTISCENVSISSGIDFILNSGSSGIDVYQGLDAPLMLYENDWSGVGNAIGVPTIEYYKSGRNTIAGDIICSQKFYAKNSAGTKTEFARIEASVRNTSAGNDDGSIGFSGLINGTMTEFFRVNGADSENNCFLPLDMNNQTIKSSSGNIKINATDSSGTGNIQITPKATGNLILANLPTSSAGLPSGAVWNNLGVLSIAP